MSDTLYVALSIGVVAVVTGFTRALPYLIFGRRELPGMVSYLGKALPASIMVVLVLYCIRNAGFTVWPFGLAELISVALVALLQIWRKNTVLSIIAGTACYMILIRTVFA